MSSRIRLVHRLAMFAVSLVAALVLMGASGIDAAQTLGSGRGELHVTETILFLTEGQTDSFSLHLAAPPLPGERVIVTPLHSHPSQFSVSPASRTFTINNWDKPRPFTVTALDDTLIEVPLTGIVVFRVTLRGESVIPLAAVDIRINDND